MHLTPTTAETLKRVLKVLPMLRPSALVCAALLFSLACTLAFLIIRRVVEGL
jgi:hypothetical protein